MWKIRGITLHSLRWDNRRRSTNLSTTDHSERYVASPCAERAPSFGAADNGGAPKSLRAQNRSVCDVMVCPGFGRASARTTAHIG